MHAPPPARAPRIRVLPPLLVNKIAAGEVIERPASVVKETIENAIDAAATHISVDIEEGGRQLIRITDDGSGMTPEELELAVTPHATSKITREEDLFEIGTMGFRGEALASISAVSDLRIVSRTPDSDEAHEIRVVAEQRKRSIAAGAPVGTRLEVRDLFFNVPARRKFLRTPASEMGHIHEQVTRAALSSPHIGFDVTSNGRKTRSVPAGQDRLARIGKFFGEELAEALMRTERDERGTLLDAYIAPPSKSRGTAQWQYTFVNGRYVRDKYIQHAIREAYRGLMEPSRHGVVFLFIEVNPADVDVNVHPTKIEVRWANANLIHSQVLSALRETFQRADLAPALSTRRAQRELDPAEQMRVMREAAEAFKSMKLIDPKTEGPRLSGPSSFPNAPNVGRSENPFDRGSSSFDSAQRPMPPSPLPVSENTRAAWEALYGRGISSPAHPPSSDHSNETSTDSNPLIDRGVRPSRLPESTRADEGSVRAVQMHNLYLVAETDEGIVIIDQHALHERVMFEELKARITRGPLEAQRLLLPETLRVTSTEMATLEESAHLLEKLGIEVTPFGADSLAIHAFPSLLKDTQVPGFMRDMLDKLGDQHEKLEPEELLNDLLAMMACKAAVKAGDPLTPDEITALMQKRHLIEKPGSCPHGRPTTLKLTKTDLNRQFHRT